MFIMLRLASALFALVAVGGLIAAVVSWGSNPLEFAYGVSAFISGFALYAGLWALEDIAISLRKLAGRDGSPRDDRQLN